MNEETRAVDVYENEPTVNGKLKAFGIVAIILGVLKLVARMVIYLRFNFYDMIRRTPHNEEIIETMKKNKITPEQMNSTMKGLIIAYAAIGFIVLLIIGILAIKGASSGNAKGLKILLIIYLIFSILALLFSFGAHTVIGVFGILTIIVAIFGIVYASKVNKQ